MVKKVFVRTTQPGITVRNSLIGEYKFPEDGTVVEMPKEHLDILMNPEKGGINGLFFEAVKDIKKPKKKPEEKPEPEETPEEKKTREEKERDEKRKTHDSSFEKLR